MLLKMLGAAVLVFLSWSCTPAEAAVLHDEAVSGDFSDSGASPTRLTAVLGSNQLFGSTGSGPNGVDRDYFTLQVPVGLAIASAYVLTGTAIGGSVSFIGLEAGNTVTVPPNARDAAGLLGWAHYSAAEIGQNILPAMGMSANGSSGFVPPLAAGNYSFWVQEFSLGQFPYGFDFVLAPVAVSEPHAGALVVIAAICISLFHCGRGRSSGRLPTFGAPRS